MNEEITFVIEEQNQKSAAAADDIISICMPGAEYYNFNTEDVNSNDNDIDERLIYYNWFADTATTSHITNQLSAFKTFKSQSGGLVRGLNNVKATIQGRGNIELESEYDGNKYILNLKDVLYIPRNQNNLISIGQWDKYGGTYQGWQWPTYSDYKKWEKCCKRNSDFK